MEALDFVNDNQMIKKKRFSRYLSLKLALTDFKNLSFNHLEDQYIDLGTNESNLLGLVLNLAQDMEII